MAGKTDCFLCHGFGVVNMPGKKTKKIGFEYLLVEGIYKTACPICCEFEYSHGIAILGNEQDDFNGKPSGKDIFVS